MLLKVQFGENEKLDFILEQEDVKDCFHLIIDDRFTACEESVKHVGICGKRSFKSRYGRTPQCTVYSLPAGGGLCFHQNKEIYHTVIRKKNGDKPYKYLSGDE